MKGSPRAQSTVYKLLLAAIFVFLALPSRGQGVAGLPQPTDYVSDFAHVLSPETIAQLDSLASQLDHSKANAQMAIVTVNNLNGDDIDDYADNLEDHWKMGKKSGKTGADRDVLVLLAVQDHKYRIEIGYDLEGLLNDAKVGDIGRTMIPDLRAGDYDGAVTLAVDQLAQDIAADAHVTLNNSAAVPAVQPAPQQSGSPIEKLILLVIVLLFFGGFSIARMLLGWGLFFGGWGGGMGGPWMGGGGGGGFGGGGGDGFSGFGGAGGGFGGGGAGGSW